MIDSSLRSPDKIDLIIRGGTVVDGTGAPPVEADVAISGDRIASIGRLGDHPASTAIDATGLVVAPGFIDIHSHGDVTIVADPRARSALSQGVTTIVIGNCGQSPAPLPDPTALSDLTFGLSDVVEPDWTSFDAYLEVLGSLELGVNVASLIGHNAIRRAVLGRSLRAATPSELRAMALEVERALDAGAVGLSSGLEYVYGTTATTEELKYLAAIVARYDSMYAIHTRDRDFHAREAFDEAFAIAEETGVAMQISHIAPRRGAPEGTLEYALHRLERLRATGLDVACDQHTRYFGITKLTAQLPPSASAQGLSELLRQLRDPEARARFHEFRGPIHKMGLMGEWDRLILFEAKNAADWVGKDFESIGRERGQHPLDAIMDILLESDDDAMNVLFVGRVQSQEDLETAFAWPFCSPESDATTLATDGPLASQSFLGAYTWAAFYLGRIVREQEVLSLTDAVHRITQLPALRIGATDRGLVAEGRVADLAIFDPQSIGELGTVSEPNQYSLGVRHVLVNGVVSIQNGAFCPEYGGRVLRARG